MGSDAKSKYIEKDLQTLIDLLVDRIKDYDQMLSTRVFSEEEFTQCKQTLAELHAAIKEKAEALGYSMKNIFPSYPSNEAFFNFPRKSRG
jgi:hypothetical protein